MLIYVAFFYANRLTPDQVSAVNCTAPGRRTVADRIDSASTATHTPGQLWVHRKGAAPLDAVRHGAVVIPGSRGSASYVVVPRRAGLDGTRPSGDGCTTASSSTAAPAATPASTPTTASSQAARAGFSLAHGAGRRWTRTKAAEHGPRLVRGVEAGTAREALGSKVIWGDKRALYEEVPEAYKDIDCVIDDLVSFGLVDVVAVLHPVLTFKA